MPLMIYDPNDGLYAVSHFIQMQQFQDNKLESHKDKYEGTNGSK